MIDIFNVDKLLGELGKNLKEIFNQWLLNSLNYRNTKINPKNLNLYVNNSITKLEDFM